MWPTVKETGQMTLSNVGLNRVVMETLIKMWAPQFTAPVMIPVDLLKAEATCQKKGSLMQDFSLCVNWNRETHPHSHACS